MPVTHGVTSSSLVRTANEALEIQFSKVFLVLGGTGSAVMGVDAHGACQRSGFYTKPTASRLAAQLWGVCVYWSAFREAGLTYLDEMQ